MRIVNPTQRNGKKSYKNQGRLYLDLNNTKLLYVRIMSIKLTNVSNVAHDRLQSLFHTA